jgi:hypothetical protein
VDQLVEYEYYLLVIAENCGNTSLRRVNAQFDYKNAAWFYLSGVYRVCYLCFLLYFFGLGGSVRAGVG